MADSTCPRFIRVIIWSLFYLNITPFPCSGKTIDVCVSGFLVSLSDKLFHNAMRFSNMVTHWGYSARFFHNRGLLFNLSIVWSRPSISLRSSWVFFLSLLFSVTRYVHSFIYTRLYVSFSKLSLVPLGPVPGQGLDVAVSRSETYTVSQCRHSPLY